jgi:glycosyltransferase involved in cell wall biosynthesis
MQRKTVVLVCMVDSIHVARWIAQFDPAEVKFILFPSGPNRVIHPRIIELAREGKKFGNQISIHPFGGKLSLLLWGLDLFLGDRLRGKILGQLLKRIKPDYVHALELQHAGYLTARCLEDTALTTQFIATNYGSDIYWFERFDRHRSKIQAVLKRAQRYSAECSRDIQLAANLGFKGLNLPVFPNSGSLDITNISPKNLDSFSRKKIAIKGYHGWAGRAGAVVNALLENPEPLKGFELNFYSVNLQLVPKLLWLRWRHGMKVRIFIKGSLSHSELLSLFSESRIYIGASMTDGISTSFLEASAMGAFPIQTGTACVREWAVNGFCGEVLEDLEPRSINKAIHAALEATKGHNKEFQEFRSALLKRLSKEHAIAVARQFYDLGP